MTHPIPARRAASRTGGQAPACCSMAAMIGCRAGTTARRAREPTCASRAAHAQPGHVVSRCLPSHVRTPDGSNCETRDLHPDLVDWCGPVTAVPALQVYPCESRRLTRSYAVVLGAAAGCLRAWGPGVRYRRLRPTCPTRPGSSPRPLPGRDVSPGPPGSIGAQTDLPLRGNPTRRLCTNVMAAEGRRVCRWVAGSRNWGINNNLWTSTAQGVAEFQRRELVAGLETAGIRGSPNRRSGTPVCAS